MKCRPSYLPAFGICGFVPLLPFVLGVGDFDRMFAISSGLAAATFLALGLGKGAILGAAPLRAALQTMFLGSAAAILAYGVGLGHRTMFSVD